MIYLNIFLLFSILGYSYELIIRLVRNLSTSNLLMGPWMPIYGFGILIIFIMDLFLNKWKLKGKKKIIICFILSVLLLTILEEIGGILVEKLFFASYWNYESIPLHIGPYINIIVSFIWGIFAMLIQYLILPILIPWIKKIPHWVSYFILILIILDFIHLLIHLLLR